MQVKLARRWGVSTSTEVTSTEVTSTAIISPGIESGTVNVTGTSTETLSVEVSATPTATMPTVTTSLTETVTVDEPVDGTGEAASDESVAPESTEEADNQSEDGAADKPTQRAATNDREVVVASQDTTMDRLLGQFVIALLQDLGYTVEDKTGLGDAATLRAALQEGVVDIYPERATTSLAEYHSLPADALPATAAEALELANELDERNDISWLVNGAIVENSVLAISDELADEGIETIDDLAALMNGESARAKHLPRYFVLYRTSNGVIWIAFDL